MKLLNAFGAIRLRRATVAHVLLGAVAALPAMSLAAPFDRVSHFGGKANDVAVVGDVAFLGVGPRVVAYDVSNKAAPVLLGVSAPIPGAIEGLGYANGYLYCAAGGFGLLVVDVSDPAHPTYVRKLPLAGFLYGVEVQGNLLYIASFEDGVHIVNVANPGLPVRIGGYNTIARSYTTVTRNGMCYVADGTQGGLQIVNVSNPAAALYAGGLDTDGSAWGVALKDNYCFVADASNGLVVMDVTNPAQPVRVASLPFSGFAFDVKLVGNTALVAAKYGGLRVIDITNPLAPQLIRTLPTRYARRVIVDGNYAYVPDGDSGGLRIFDISNPTLPVQQSFVQYGGYVLDIAAQDGYAYTAAYADGLMIWDVHDPLAPRLVRQIILPSYATAVEVQGNRAYVTIAWGGVTVIDISNPLTAHLIGSIDTAYYATKVVPDGNRVFVADEFGGAYTFNVTNNAPTLIGRWPPVGWTPAVDAEDVAFLGDKMYIAAYEQGVLVLDLSVPSDALLINVLPTANYAKGVTVHDGKLYVGEMGAGMSIFDLSDPANPHFLSRFRSTGQTWHVGVDDDGFAYLANNYGGFDIVDVSNPFAVRRVAYEYTPGLALDVAVDNGYVYLASEGAGVYVYEGPTPPVEPTPCPADLDGNRRIELGDLGVLFACWGQPCGDLNDDNQTDLADLGLLLAEYGQRCD